MENESDIKLRKNPELLRPKPRLETPSSGFGRFLAVLGAISITSSESEQRSRLRQWQERYDRMLKRYKNLRKRVRRSNERKTP